MAMEWQLRLAMESKPPRPTEAKASAVEVQHRLTVTGASAAEVQVTGASAAEVQVTGASAAEVQVTGASAAEVQVTGASAAEV